MLPTYLPTYLSTYLPTYHTLVRVPLPSSALNISKPQGGAETLVSDIMLFIFFRPSLTSSTHPFFLVLATFSSLFPFL